MQILDLIEGHQRPLVVIAHFKDMRGDKLQSLVPQNPAVHFQVTLDKQNLSKSQKFMRFGQRGDEVTGWQLVDYIEVDEVLGELQEDGKTVSVWSVRELAA